MPQGIVDRMLKSIFHRGPDDFGRLRDGELDMGMRRLSIVDLTSGHQPIFNEDGRFAIVFNGEIYNHQDLRMRLIQSGHALKTRSDTEVIVHLYEQYGPDCVKHLRGMFAFAVWDARERSLFIARDHLGVKPLYYTNHNDRLVFGSEIKAILQHPDVTPALNLPALSDYLSIRYVPSPSTLFEGIKVLPAGHWLISSQRGVKLHQYWDVCFEETADGSRKPDDYAEELEALLNESIKAQLMSDVPFGAFLSGGIDSSSVVALMSKNLEQPVKTFSVGFDRSNEECYSELSYARLVAEKYRTQHHEIFVSAKDFVDDLPKVVWHLDQPIADYAQVAYLKVSQLAARHVKMVLTGEGGDELFAGYSRYIGERYSNIFRLLPGPLLTLARRAASRIKRYRRPATALYALTQTNEAMRFASWIPQFNHSDKYSLISDGLRGALRDHRTDDHFSQHLGRVGSPNPVNRMLYVDTKLWLPDYLLVRGDKLTMAASLEGRVPLLDHKLVEFAAQLPAWLKLRGTTTKFLLKEVSSKLLPQENVKRTKKGFPVPVPLWLRTDARPLMRDLLSRDVLVRRGQFNPDFVSNLINEHESGKIDHATTIYGLMCLELWQQQFIDHRPAAQGVEPKDAA